MRFNPFENSPLKGGVLGYVPPFHKCMNAISSTDQRLQVCIPRGTILIEGKSHGDFRVVGDRTQWHQEEVGQEDLNWSL